MSHEQFKQSGPAARSYCVRDANPESRQAAVTTQVQTCSKPDSKKTTHRRDLISYGTVNHPALRPSESIVRGGFIRNSSRSNIL